MVTHLLFVKTTLQENSIQVKTKDSFSFKIYI